MMRTIIIILIGYLSASAASHGLPCHILDSVDITSGLRQPDGSVLFGGIMYSKDQYATVDYIVVDGVKKFDDLSHIRGCACHIRPCLRFCCPFGVLRTESDGTRVCPQKNESPIDVYQRFLNGKNVTNKIVEVDMHKNPHHFAFVDGFPCKSMYASDDFFITQVIHFLFTFSFNSVYKICVTFTIFLHK